MKNRIFIFGHYGEKNTGDDAMIYVLLQQLSSIYPNVFFSIISPRKLFVPSEIENKIKIVEPTPFQVFREIKNSSIFVMGGGTQIYESGNKFERVKVLSEILIIVIWARIFCRRIYYLNIGVEPLNTTFRKFLSEKILKLADFITTRDNLSFTVLNDIKLEKVEKSFDLAILLNKSSINNPKNSYNTTLGISILPFYEIYHGKEELDQLVVENIADTLNKWQEDSSKNRIQLYVFKGKSRSDDFKITQLLKNKLVNQDKVELIQYNSNPLKMLSKFNECDMFIGMRYHSCLFAYATKTPLLVISYLQKCNALAEEIGLPDNAVLTIGDVVNGKFGDYFKNIQTNKNLFLAKLPRSIARKRAQRYFDSEYGEFNEDFSN